MANTIGEKELKHKWPFETGLNADSKHEGRIKNLIPEGQLGKKTIVRQRNKIGL